MCVRKFDMCVPSEKREGRVTIRTIMEVRVHFDRMNGEINGQCKSQSNT
jgi:hypothetical protein